MKSNDLENRIKRLEEAFETFSKDLHLAYQYMQPDAASSLTKSRVVLEKLIKKLYITEMGREPKKPLLVDMLADNQFTRKIDRRILSRMNAIRDLANLGAHGEHVVASDATRALDDLAEVLDWYLQRSEKTELDKDENPKKDDDDDDDEPISLLHEKSMSPAEPILSLRSDSTLPIENQFKALRVVLLYKRGAQPDEKLLGLVESQLIADGHSVFIDRHMSIGVEWAKQIEQEIRHADAIVVLLSPASIYSEMLAYEVEVAHHAAQENAGKPRLFPVRINFEDLLPQELAGKLEPLHYFLWRSPEDDTRLVNELTQALISPPRVPPTPIGNLERDTGAVPLDSKFYLERPADKEFQAAIARHDMIVLLKGEQQMGKTSLLARGMEIARQNGVQVVLTDLQKLASAQFQNLESFFQAIGELLADQLDLDTLPQDTWRPNRSPNVNFERYVRLKVLANVPGQLLWAMDEVDRLFNCGFSGDVFALFRTWHNECALDTSKLWSRLTLAIASATEAHLFISDPNESPFNVGTKIILEDFTSGQVADLNRRYGSPLRDGAELRRFYQLVGGQPYLVRRSLNEIVNRGMTIDKFEASADHDDGPLGDHLRRILVMLARNPQLCEVVRSVLRDQPCLDYDSFYRLRSAGVLSGESKDTARLRCGIYETYLRRQLS